MLYNVGMGKRLWELWKEVLTIAATVTIAVILVARLVFGATHELLRFWSEAILIIVGLVFLGGLAMLLTVVVGQWIRK